MSTPLASRFAFRALLLGALFFPLFLRVHAANPGHADTTGQGWTDLFAPDLSNTLDAKGWKMEQGVLVATNHDTLWTREAYGDFVLDLEFKVAKEANSGVFLRAGNPKNVMTALEIQVHDNTDGSKYGMVGALYDAKPPMKSAIKPTGEWNRYTITCRGSKLTVVLNGELIQDLDLADWTEAKKNPDGTPNKFPVALKDFARQGPIGLQGLHGKAAAPVWFRHLRIKRLD